ncbi:MAG TPA: CocE/NonD family hydrolase [Burkholderiales bacterium]|nr:CocE/NonD family hydrolase [Burkholderiales bacterium]
MTVLLRTQRRAACFALALLLSALPAIAAQQTSTAKYKVITEHNVMVPMRDGTRLAIDIYRPDAPGKFPALVERTPYDKTKSSEIQVGAHTFFAERGYVFMVQDTRGRFASEGTFYPFLDDGWLQNKDGYDTVQWIAQQPWSDGKVGVLGGSYTGQTAYMIAPTQPPALQALFVRESASNLFDHWVYRGGAFELGFIATWSTRTFGPDIVARAFPDAAAAADAKRRLDASIANQDKDLWSLPLDTYPPLDWAPGWRYFYDWVEHNTDGPYWAQQNVGLNHSRFQVPVYHLGGWYDIFLKGTLENFAGLRKNAATALARDNQKLVIGPWVHGPTNVGKVEVGELKFPGADAVDYNAIRLKWFDHWLKGIDTGVMREPPILIYVMGANVWRTESEWPPARARFTPYYLRAGSPASRGTLYDGALSVESPEGAEGPASYVYDPRDPAPTLGGNTLFIASGPTDHRRAEAKSLTFTGEPLTQDLEVTGPVKAVLYAMSSAVDTDWVVRLTDVYPDGRSILIVDGLLRARYRDSAREPALIAPGRVYRYDVDLWATSNVFKAGHRLRVSVTSSNFPRWDRNLNTAESPEAGAHPEIAINTVFFDAPRASYILLPVIPER